MRNFSFLSLTAFVPVKNNRSKAVKLSLLAFLFCCFSYSGFATSITPGGGGTNICPTLAVGGSSPAFTPLGTITVSEGLNSDFSAGTDHLTLNAPTGWQFDPSTPPVLNFTLSGNITGLSIASFTSASITIDINCSDITLHDAFTITGLGVQATSTSATPGYIYSTTAIGVLGITTGAGGTNFGNLSLSSGAIAPSVTITASPTGSVCAGIGITFTPAPVNGGPTPTYQWFVNSVFVGTGNTFSSSVLSSGDAVNCIMTSSATCVSTPTATSNIITVSVTPLPLAQTVTGGGSYCAGATGAHIGLSGSEPGVSYQVYFLGSPVGAPVTGTGASLDLGPFTAAGTYTVRGTAGVSCFTNMIGSATISIIPGPLAFSVTGGGGFCSAGTGSDVGLAGSAVGVIYQLELAGSPVSVPLGGTGAALDFGLQTAPGIYTVVATDGTTGCSATMTGSVVVSVIAPPTAFAVTGGGTFCSGSTGVPVGLAGSELGVNYQLFDGAVPVGPAMAGTGAAFSFGFENAGGIYKVVATNTSTGCVANMLDSAILIVNALPNAFSVLGGGGYCIGGTGSDISLSGSDIGVNYQLLLGVAPVGASVTGSGSSLDFGLQTSAGTYTIVGTNATTSCSVDMSGTATVTVNALPLPFTITGGGFVCAGGTGVDVSLGGSVAGVNYQLLNSGSPVGGPVPGTGAAISFGLQTAAGIYTASATDATTGCTNTMTGSVVIAVNPAPTAYTVLGGGGYCAGGTGVDISLSSTDVGINYQMFNSGTPVGVPVGGTGGAFDFGIQTAAGTYTIVGTNATTLCTANMSGSAVVVINPLPFAFTVTGGGAYCLDGTGVDIGLSGSAVGVNYQLFNGPTGLVVLPGTGLALDFGLQTLAGAFTVVATDATTGCVSTMAGSPSVTINPLPTAYTVTGGGSYCSGGTGVDVGLSSSDAGVTYQLFNTFVATSVPQGGTGAALDFGLQTAAGFYTIVATTSATGCSNTMAGGVAVTILPLPDLFTVTGGGAFCAGGTGVDVGLSGSVVGINYQLYNNGFTTGLPVAGTGLALDFGLQNVAGNYTVVATDASSLCTSNMTGSALVTANPLPNVFFMTGGGFYCQFGTGVDIGLTGSDVAVNYQLFVGSTAVGAPVAGTGSGLDFGFQTVAGIYTVVATNPATGCTNTMSGTATVTINPAPFQYAVTGGGAECVGGLGVDVGLAFSQVGINYQLYLGGVATGSSMAGTGGALDFGLQTTSGVCIVVATDATTSCSDTMVGSVTVYIAPIPTVYTISSGGVYCEGTAGFDLSMGGSDTGVNYQIYNGGSPVGAPIAGTGLPLDLGLQPSGVYTVVGVNAIAGCSATMSGTSIITMNAAPTLYTVAGGATFCATITGSDVNISGSDAGINYQLYNGSTPVGGAVAGTGVPGILDMGIQTVAGTYKVVATNTTTGCTDTMTGSAVIAVVAYPVVDGITGPTEVCQFAAIALADDSTGGVWASADETIATVGPSGIVSGVAAGAVDISYTITNSAGCATTVSVNITVNAAPFVAPITGPATVCAGLTIGLADITAGGTWSSGDNTIATVNSSTGVVTGVAAGGVTISYATPVAGGCPGLALAAITVGPAIAASSISPAGPLTLCNGTPITLDVSTPGGGPGLTYQWSSDGTDITGATDLSYTDSLPGSVTVAVSNGVCSDILPTVTILPKPDPIITLDTLGNVLLAGSFTRWQWYLNGDPIPGATSNFAPDNNIPGSVYTVIVWDINNCSDTSAPFIVPGTISGVHTVYTGKDIKIYPNPASNVLHIDAPIKVFVSILSPDGKELIARKEAISVNVGQLADGMYVIMVYDENNTLLKTDKFVKME